MTFQSTAEFCSLIVEPCGVGFVAELFAVGCSFMYLAKGHIVFDVDGDIDSVRSFAVIRCLQAPAIGRDMMNVF